MRIFSTLLAGVAFFGLPGPVSAQTSDDAGADDRDVKVTVVLIPQGGAGLAEQTLVSVGLRRGIRADSRLDDEHPADVLIREQPDFLYDALSEPDAIAELVSAGSAGEAEGRAHAVLEIFEQYLDLVKRSMLAETYALLAVAQCMQRHRDECEDSFRRVVVFREHFFYDTERYPPQFEQTFQNVQTAMVETGIRGSIEVLTEPVGAEVFVDGRSYGPSPAIVEGLLVGDHYVTTKAIGYQKDVRRETVEESFQNTIEVPLETSDESLMITQAMDNIPRELGERRAGDAIRSLGTNLHVDQAVIGTIRPAGDGRTRVTLYLYDLRTKFLLAEEEREIGLDPEGGIQAQEMLAALYEGVDLSGRIEAPNQGPNFDEATPFYLTWWFWSAIGVVVVGVTTAAIFVATTSGNDSLNQPGWHEATGTIE